YYWWALRGVSLPMPAERQVAVVTEKNDDFRRLKKHLTAGSVVADSFFARREGLSVFAGKRTDDPYQTLEKVSRPEWDKGYVRSEIIKSAALGVKRGVPKGQAVDETVSARTYAILLKALEEEWEATSISHEASRQLVYSTGLLPRKVHVPEWAQFGVGSFFERPLQSPWGGPGAPNPYWLPRFKEYLKAKKYGPTDYAALVSVVTDAGFRGQPEAVTPQP